MKRILLTILTFSPAFIISSSAQNLTGIWRGYFITDNGDQYRFEVQMEQTRNHTLSGVTYSYLDKRFYGKCSMTGNYTTASGNALIQEIKSIEVKTSFGSATCIQKCLLNYTKSGREEFLEGEFSSAYEKTDSLAGVIRGEDCGGGKMMLRKVKTSDFYVEPFLRRKTNPVNTNPPLVKNNNSSNNTVKSTPKPQTNTQKKTDQSKTPEVNKPKNETIAKAENDGKPDNDKTNLTIKTTPKLPGSIRSRENSLVQTLIVNTETVSIKLYDNGEIDDDTISVYLDDKLILANKRLSTVPISLNLKMDESNAEHELVMVAENMGRIPPNTSLMIVTAGDKRYEVRITSTEQKNAMVRFKYVKRTTP